MQDVLTAAIEMHQAGQLGPAAQLYQKVLAQEKENAVALHLLGVLHHQQGDHARGDRADRPGGGDAAERAGISTPTWPRRTGRSGEFDRAVGCCRAALALWPDYPEALCNLGPRLQGLGKKRRGRRAARPGPGAAAGFRRGAQQPGDRAARAGPDRRGAGAFPPGRRARAGRSRRRGPTWARCSWTAARPTRPCRTARRRSGSSPTWRPCTTTSAMPCGRWTGCVEARPRTWRHCGWTRSWPVAHAHLGLILQRRASSRRLCSG